MENGWPIVMVGRSVCRQWRDILPLPTAADKESFADTLAFHGCPFFSGAGKCATINSHDIQQLDPRSHIEILERL